MFLMEGQHRRTPKNRAELAASFERFEERITKHFPKGRVVPVKADAISGAEALLDQRRHRYTREVAFLIDVVRC